MSDPIRQTVLLRLSDGPAFPSELAELAETSRSNLSNHLACLRGCGLVVAERQGRRVQYELVTQRLGGVLADIATAMEETILEGAHGRVIASGPPHDVITPEKLARAYGGAVLHPEKGVHVIDDPAHADHA